MTQNSKKLTFIVCLFLFLGGWVFGILTFFAERPRFIRSADHIADSDQEWYDNVFNPSARIPPLDLFASPPPKLSRNSQPSSYRGTEDVVFSLDQKSSFSGNQIYELFQADEEGLVTLPGGTRLSISAVALSLPSDTDWQVDDEPNDLVPAWIDPQTGKRLSDVKQGEAWKIPRSTPTSSPRLHFQIQVAGDTPIRWRVPAIHDARTRRSIGGAVSGATILGEGFFSMELETWHQTALDIGVDFAFGEPEIKTLPLAQGAEVRFGDQALVMVADAFPHSYRFVRWKEEETIFSVYQKPQRSSGQGAALLVWPRHQDLQIEFQPHVELERSRVIATRGIGGLKWKKEGAQVSELKVYRYPRLGRAVFHLPSLPGLPDVENLFEVPISKIRVKYPGNFLRYAANAAGVERGFSYRSEDLAEMDFPVFLNDTTPEQMFSQFEQMSGTTLYYNAESNQLTDRKPPTVFDRIRDWYRKKMGLPTWGP